MILRALGPVREGGGTLFVLAGAPPRAGVQWTLLEGGGELVPQGSRADAGGVATARYVSTSGVPAVAGQTVRVRAEAFDA